MTFILVENVNLQNNIVAIEELKFTNNYTILADHIKAGLEKRPDSEALKDMRKALIDIGVYVMNLQNRYEGYEEQLQLAKDKIKYNNKRYE